MAFMAFLFLLLLPLCGAVMKDGELLVDRNKMGPTFDGLGAISGGGATSRLLPAYPEPQRSEILDLLFKPNYAASLQILKVEIGGDSQSTDGSEASHMHQRDEVDFHAGYEWWLMLEAKKRNPDIKLYGLPWAFPGWVGTDPTGTNATGSPFMYPFQTADYVVQWVKGAKLVYNLTIDYIGIWNERASDATYVQTLRAILDREGFAATKIVANDGWGEICPALQADKEYVKVVDIIGLHYPSDFNDYTVCHSFGKPVWASEESSSYDDLNGAACWARVVNSHFVLSGMTSSLMWNLVGSYYHGTEWYASSLLTAVEPWSGHYEVAPVVWATAHITQHINIGWRYLRNGYGSGELPHGGYYTTTVDPVSHDFTIQVVKVSHDHAACTRPPLPTFNVSAELVTFVFASRMKVPPFLAVRYSNYETPDAPQFVQLADVEVRNKRFSLFVEVGAFFTISTVRTAQKGLPHNIPPSQPQFPLPWTESFDNYADSQQPPLLTDQIGCFEVHKDASDPSNKVLRQMVTARPIGWTDAGSRGPISLVGQIEWQDISLTTDFRLLPDTTAAAACVSTRVDQMWTKGIALCIDGSGLWNLTIGGPVHDAEVVVIAHGLAGQLASDRWHTITLVTSGDMASAQVDGKSLFEGQAIRDIDTGFAAIGSNSWYRVEFDNVHIEKAGPHWTPHKTCPSPQIGSPVTQHRCSRNGVPDPSLQWSLESNWQLRHTASKLCATADSLEPGSQITLQDCSPTDPHQQFKNDYTRVRNEATPLFLRTQPTITLSGSQSSSSVSLQKQNSEGYWQKWVYYPNTGQVRNQYNADPSMGYPLCLSACGRAPPVRHPQTNVDI